MSIVTLAVFLSIPERCLCELSSNCFISVLPDGLHFVLLSYIESQAPTGSHSRNSTMIVPRFDACSTGIPQPHRLKIHMGNSARASGAGPMRQCSPHPQANELRRPHYRPVQRLVGPFSTPEVGTLRMAPTRKDHGWSRTPGILVPSDRPVDSYDVLPIPPPSPTWSTRKP